MNWLPFWWKCIIAQSIVDIVLLTVSVKPAAAVSWHVAQAAVDRSNMAAR